MDIETNEAGDPKYKLSLLDGDSNTYEYEPKSEEEPLVLEIIAANSKKPDDKDVIITLKTGPNMDGGNVVVVEYIHSHKLGSLE